VVNAKSIKDITTLVRYLEKNIAKIQTPTVSQDAEWLYSAQTKLEVVSVKKDLSTQTVEVELKEVSR